MSDSILFRNDNEELNAPIFTSLTTQLDVNKSTEFRDVGKVDEITEKDKLFIAGKVLLGLGIIFVIGIVISWLSHQEAIFDGCKTVIPPIATLILGYYFSRK